MATRLTKKEQGFVKDYLETGNGVEAALKNYDTTDYSTAGVIAHENLKKPKIRLLVDEAFPDDVLFEVHREGLYATREYYDSKGEFKGDVADFGVRHKYLETAYKLKGSFAPTKTLNVNVEVEADEVVEKLTQELNEIYKGTSITGDGEATVPVGTETQD